MSESSAATSSGSGAAGKSVACLAADQTNLDFKILFDQKNGQSYTLHLVAPTMQEKQAWISDIGQVLK